LMRAYRWLLVSYTFSGLRVLDGKINTFEVKQ